MQKDFDSARQIDSIAQYQKFQSVHPDSEHDEWIASRIEEIRRNEEIERQRLADKIEREIAIYSQRLAKQAKLLKSYRQEKLTREAFREVWDFTSETEILGIIGVEGSRDRLTYFIGEISNDKHGVDILEMIENTILKGTMSTNKTMNFQYTFNSNDILIEKTFMDVQQD
ncbi:MAG: hypothetical protein GY797_27175 [Deltaproteobacteria bacterium]|nr:hypothetical protein [Deltaproteobacteria bacterium]